MSKPKLIFHPIISSIQRIALYETKARFYLIGSNNTETRFRVLKIDRTVPKELVLVDDKVEYNKNEIHQLIHMIGNGNRGKGFNRLVSGFGIVGFVRFLEGYYIILVKKRRKVAVIGCHSIYKIEETTVTYIPSDTSKPTHPDELRYLKMFQAIDLSTNFYYSYSYDITHTLQMNMAPPRRLGPSKLPSPRSWIVAKGDGTSCTCGAVDDSDKDEEDIFRTWQSQLEQRSNKAEGGTEERLQFGVRPVPEWRFVWNTHLLGPVHARLHPDWLLYVVHGFIEQTNLNIFGRPVYLTLIARRSNRYAGTRYLKRGANIHGDVANEVETEQIVHDSMVSSFEAGRYSSFVQLRGSIPSHWSQDVVKMVPKPAINIDLADPYAEVAARHVNNLLRRYGSPLVILNLVKKREARKHESLLTDVISGAVKYLNQFLPPEHAVQYFHIDMARMNKGADSEVLDKLTTIARSVVKRTGVFLSPGAARGGAVGGVGGGAVGGVGAELGARLQTGLVRVNCVDCLDRTNTAQFAIGKCVLGHQLYALGLVASPQLLFDSDCMRLLEGLYEDHGDTLALQYGGSQLVHRIKTYRKTAPWSSHGNDIMQTLSRYLSNTFSDWEKQHTMNLFLGLFRPGAGRAHIWDYATDYYLHHPEACFPVPRIRRSLTQWWDKEVLKHLPRPCNEMTKQCCEIVGIQAGGALEMVDLYHDCLRPFEITYLAETFEFEMVHTLRNLAPNTSENLSPFVVRYGPGTLAGKPAPKNPVMSGHSSQASNNSDDDSGSSSTGEELSVSGPSPRPPQPPPPSAQPPHPAPPAAPFPAARRTNRRFTKEPPKRDMLLYKRYVEMERKSGGSHAAGSRGLTVPSGPSELAASGPAAPGAGAGSSCVRLRVLSALSVDSSAEVIPPTVSRAARHLYAEYLRRALPAPAPSHQDLITYHRYVNFTL